MDNFYALTNKEGVVLNALYFFPGNSYISTGKKKLDLTVTNYNNWYETKNIYKKQRFGNFGANNSRNPELW